MGNRSPRKISSLINPTCSRNPLAARTVTIVTNQGVAAKLSNKDGETTGRGKGGAGDTDIFNQRGRGSGKQNFNPIWHDIPSIERIETMKVSRVIKLPIWMLTIVNSK
jgi:hypothetical protein